VRLERELAGHTSAINDPVAQHLAASKRLSLFGNAGFPIPLVITGF
jgi:hypothetical protein